MVSLNFSNVKTFGALPIDRVYGAEVVKSEYAQTKAGGERAWQFDVKITDGAGSEEAVGQQLFNTQSLGEASAWKTMELLNALGEEISKETTDFQLDPADYMGREIGVTVVNEEYQGEMRAKPGKYVSSNFAGYMLNDPALTGAEA